MRPILILASTSPYRRTLLERLGLPFEVEAPAVEETSRPGESPRELARRLAGEKARAVARRRPGTLVIGSDQVCALGSGVLGKPGTPERARAQLGRCSARQVDFFTAVALVRDAGTPALEHVDHTRVRFRDLGAGQIRDYVARDSPLDCAGAFRCEGLGIALFESISGDDPTALIGLPLIAVTSLLRDAGIDVLEADTDP